MYILKVAIIVVGSDLRRKGGGVHRVQIMKNELKCLGDRKGHDDHLAKKFLAISALILTVKTKFLNLKNLPSSSTLKYPTHVFLE